MAHCERCLTMLPEGCSLQPVHRTSGLTFASCGKAAVTVSLTLFVALMTSCSTAAMSLADATTAPAKGK